MSYAQSGEFISVAHEFWNVIGIDCVCGVYIMAVDVTGVIGGRWVFRIIIRLTMIIQNVRKRWTKSAIIINKIFSWR